MENQTNALHDLRREFQNMLGLLKIINSDLKTDDQELKEMIQLSLQREDMVMNRFKELEKDV